MLGASISKEKVKSLTECHVYLSSSVCYFYFSPVTDKTQPICYTVILLWFLILISLFDSTVVTLKENLCIGQIEASKCPPPPWQPPGIWLFWKLLFKFPPNRAKMPFKCPTQGSIRVIKCPHRGDISQAHNDRRTAETPSVVEQNLYKYSK